MKGLHHDNNNTNTHVIHEFPHPRQRLRRRLPGVQILGRTMGSGYPIGHRGLRPLGAGTLHHQVHGGEFRRVDLADLHLRG